MGQPVEFTYMGAWLGFHNAIAAGGSAMSGFSIPARGETGRNAGRPWNAFGPASPDRNMCKVYVVGSGRNVSRGCARDCTCFGIAACRRLIASAAISYRCARSLNSMRNFRLRAARAISL